MNLSFHILVLSLAACLHTGSRETSGREPRWSEKIAKSFLQRYPDAIPYNAGNPEIRWNYEPGLIYVALLRMWEATGEQRYFDIVRKNLDLFVEHDGTIKTYKRSDFNLDMILSGRALLKMHTVTGEQKYRLAADTLRGQLREQPKTPSGGFWHKKIYPNQMWLDGIFMAEPFYAEYGVAFNEPSAFESIVDQITLIEQKTRDPKTGLLYHGWDESKEQRWANPETGTSPHFWGRAMGWYAMGVVDVLDSFPEDHPKRGNLLALLQRFANAILKYQDSRTGLWYQVVDQGEREGNYLEASASSMFTYVLAKGVRKGYIDPSFRKNAEGAFQGILSKFVTITEDGLVNLHNVCAVAGLGGNPYRDGSFEYYISEPRRTNDFKGIGAFLLAAMEIEALK
jgi:unsaturated rhamnogalacturonyl hydrolase